MAGMFINRLPGIGHALVMTHAMKAIITAANAKKGGGGRDGCDPPPRPAPASSCGSTAYRAQDTRGC